MDKTERWFIHRLTDGTCAVVSQQPNLQDAEQTWGPFEAQGEALARRVGLIRSGHCKPRLEPDVPQPEI